MDAHLSLLPSPSFFLFSLFLFVFFVGVFSVAAALFPHHAKSTVHRAVHSAVHHILHAVHRGASRNCRGSQIDSFKARSTFLCQSLPATHQSTAFTGVLRSIRHQPHPLPMSTRRSVYLTRPRVDLTRRRVVLTRRSVRIAERLSSAVAAVYRTFCYFSVFFLVFLLSVLGYCLLILQCLVSLVETFVTGFVVPLFATVPVSDSNSAITASASLRLLLFPSGGSDRFALICSPIASVTAICGQIEKAGTLVCPIPYCLFVISHCSFRFGCIVGEPTPFSVFCFFVGSPTLFSFRIKSGKDPPL